MVARIDTPYNAKFGRPLLKNLSVVMSPRYLLMKFKIDRGIAFITVDHIEVRKG